MNRLRDLVLQKFLVVIAENTVTASGGIFYAQDTKKILVAKRALHKDLKEPGTWSGWGGKQDKEELPEDTVRREIKEEAGYTGPLILKKVYTFKSPTLSYNNYLIVVPKEFTPILNWENSDYLWTTLGELPFPLHSGFKSSLPYYQKALLKDSINEI